MRFVRSLALGLAALAAVASLPIVTADSAEAGWRVRRVLAAQAAQPRIFGGGQRFGGFQRAAPAFAAPVAAAPRYYGGGARYAAPGWGGQRHGYRGGGWRPGGAAIAAGIIGGLATGAIIAGSSRPAYAYPAQTQYDPQYYAPAQYGHTQYAEEYEDEEPQCFLSRRKVWIDDVRWVYRKVRVCR